MLKKFAFWFICFGASLFIQTLDLAEQGKAFLCINLGIKALVVLIAIAVIALKVDEPNENLLGLVLSITESMALMLLATWGATKLFSMDFYMAYQIMTFAKCLNTNGTKEND